MKNTGVNAWLARLDYFKNEYPFGPIKRITNEEGRLHCDNGPALITPTRITHYQNGRKHGIDADKFGSISYYYENIRIPPNFFHNPENLTVSEVLGHANAEVRYVGIKIIGMEKIMGSESTEIIDKDAETGMVLFKIFGVFEEPINYLKVINSTQEIDGTYKNYFLCIPPEINKCKQAVAWTFGMDADEYKPSQET